MTQSISRTDGKTRIPIRFHTRLAWIDAKSRCGWVSNAETWRDLCKLQKDLTPYLESEEENESGKERQ